jgi:hypothetical protein
LKEARNGFAGFSPTMSGISLGEFKMEVFAIRIMNCRAAAYWIHSTATVFNSFAILRQA